MRVHTHAQIITVSTTIRYISWLPFSSTLASAHFFPQEPLLTERGLPPVAAGGSLLRRDSGLRVNPMPGSKHEPDCPRMRGAGRGPACLGDHDRGHTGWQMFLGLAVSCWPHPHWTAVTVLMLGYPLQTTVPKSQEAPGAAHWSPLSKMKGLSL